MIAPTFDLVLADPPWKYSFSRSRSRRVENQYPTMTVPEIVALKDLEPLTLVKPRAILYLWATMPKLLTALVIMEAWGFEYKTGDAWDKEIIGQGYYSRGQHELLLVGTRGGFSPPPPSRRLSSVIRERRGAHSCKPEKAYAKIEFAYPEAMKLEMFARRARAGWTTWGDEAPRAAGGAA